MYSIKQRAVAIGYGLVCHLSFALGIGAMMVGIYTGMHLGLGPLSGWEAVLFDVFLLTQFVVLHSFLLSTRGRQWLAGLAPLGLGADLSTTTFATLSSWQLLLTFGAWAPFGTLWWEPQGAVRVVMTVLYAASWLFLLRAMADAGLATQTGFLGWGAVARNRVPRFEPFLARGTFRYTRQPIYLAFSLTLWTGPTWTPDHLLLALVWTAYCLLGPRLKERRYLTYYGTGFERYQDLVPYWLPGRRALDTGFDELNG